MNVVPPISSVLVQVSPDHRTQLSPVDYHEVARWARRIGAADALAGDAARPGAFQASSVHAALSPRARRLFAFAYGRARLPEAALIG